MKSPSSDLPVGKVQTRRKVSKLAPLIALIILLTIPLYFPSITRDPFKKLVDTPIPHAAFQETIGLISEAQAPQSEQHAREPCSAGSAQCHGGEKAVDHPVAPAKKKHEKVLLIDSNMPLIHLIPGENCIFFFFVSIRYSLISFDPSNLLCSLTLAYLSHR